MRITNITDFAKNTGVKVVGIGGIQILPGETVEVPDDIALFVLDGKRQPIPALGALVRTNQIRIVESDEVVTPVVEEQKTESDEPVKKTGRGNKSTK